MPMQDTSAPSAEPARNVAEVPAPGHRVLRERMAEPGIRPDFALLALGALDHAALTILHYRDNPLDSKRPPSQLLDLFLAFHAFRTKSRLIPQTRFLYTLGSAAVSLIGAWRELPMHRDAAARYGRGPGAYYYRLASLALATALLPYLLLRKS